MKVVKLNDRIVGKESVRIRLIAQNKEEEDLLRDISSQTVGGPVGRGERVISSSFSIRNWQSSELAPARS